MLSDVWQDIRYGARLLLRAPTFTTMSVLTLALGIGATTAIFSLVWAVLLAPLPYEEPDRLVRVWEVTPRGGDRNVVSAGNASDWQERARSFSVLGAHSFPYPVVVTGEGPAFRVDRVTVQPEVLDALGAAPALGRAFVPEDAETGDVVLIGHAFWQDHFGGDPEVLGRRLLLEDVPYTVVGVMPEGFAFPTEGVQLYRPFRRDNFDPTSRVSHNHLVVARLAPGVTVESAQAEMTGLAEQIAVEHPAEMTGWSARVVPLHDDITRNVEALLWVLLGGVGVVLLITCGNIANLLLARAVGRQREIALRGALGAGRGRIVRQLLTESVMLTLAGGIGAVAVAPLVME
ncbi:MAG TPA: ABC transporter permease, partial [Longimicrobiales bacterium]|nr:ABC transporter permease [Longimicrobiales bacterium]